MKGKGAGPGSFRGERGPLPGSPGGGEVCGLGSCLSYGLQTAPQSSEQPSRASATQPSLAARIPGDEAAAVQTQAAERFLPPGPSPTLP